MVHLAQSSAFVKPTSAKRRAGSAAHLLSIFLGTTTTALCSLQLAGGCVSAMVCEQRLISSFENMAAKDGIPITYLVRV